MSLFLLILGGFLFEAGAIWLVMTQVAKDDRLCRAPALDWVIGLLSWIPWFLFSLGFGGLGVFGCVIGQIFCMYGFFWFHKKKRNYQGPSIHTTTGKIVGPLNNQLGLLMTLPALPVFLIVRYAEILLYPFLVWTMKFPKYDHGDWVQVSRQKFSGLVGADLVWCLYCDWMTGLYALGGEMLRNLESFWCPIRFYPDKKCENCQVDFPDIKEWVSAQGTVEDVNKLITEKYPSGKTGPNAWYGHPSRKK